MAIAAARVYAEGHRLRSLWLHDPDDRPVQPHQFAWIGMIEGSVTAVCLALYFAFRRAKWF